MKTPLQINVINNEKGFSYETVYSDGTCEGEKTNQYQEGLFYVEHISLMKLEGHATVVFDVTELQQLRDSIKS